VAQVAPESIQVLGDITITIGGSDKAAAIAKVELLIDGDSVASGTSLPFSWGWKTSDEESGVHELMARVTDAAGNRRVARIKVAVLSH
jgi:hypothetical protein